MMDHTKLYLLGDQTYDTQPHMKNLLQRRNNPILNYFLENAYNAIRIEIQHLSREVRNDLPRFTCIDDLVSGRQGGNRCIPLDMAVTCMYQLGAFISQADPWKCGTENSCILGLCTGALAAAAISCSHSALNLVPAAVDAIVVAFRTGMRVTDLAHQIEPSDGSDQSWSIYINSVEAELAVAQQQGQHETLPLTSQPYISVYTPNGIAVSGPPSSLARVKDLGFQSIKIRGIHGPYHAPHLYSQADVEDIVEGLGPRCSFARSNQVPLLSSTEAGLDSSNFKTLLKAAVGQILRQPIRWNGVLRELERRLHGASSPPLTVIPIGTTADQLIHNALKETTLSPFLTAPPEQRKSPTFQDDCSNSGSSKLAIVGMAGRFPGAKDNDAFWDLLYQGLDMHKPAPGLHWDVKTHVDPTGTRKNTSATPFGCWLDDPAKFDARFFNISPREAPQIDPAQRLALMTAYEAIEQAGLVPDSTPSTRRDRVGVFYGVTSNDWMETNSAQSIDTYFIPGGNRAFIPGRINYFFNFSGPSIAVDTACSSSLAGIHLACSSLWRKDIDTAIAGGTNILTNPDFTAGLDRGHFLSRTGNCKTFDDSADGYCRGEAVGTVIIKRLDDAIADQDPILGLILGASTNHSAESESITRPHVGAQRAVFRKILNQGAVDPYTVSYIEMHGTGTQAGDAGEMSSTLDTFAPPLGQVRKGRSRDESLFLGSAKANIGHGEAASGVSSLIKVLLMMQHDKIVPHCGIKTKINHRFPSDLQGRNVHIASKPTPWQKSSDPSKPRRAFVNNFSAAGGNTAVLIEDAPHKRHSANAAADPRSHHLVAISAKNGVSLQGNLKSMLQYLKRNSNISIGKLSYTTTARRQHHQHRVMLNGSSAEALCSQIEADLCNDTGVTRPKGSPRIIFTFTGQGAQYPGMGKQLFENFSLFRTEMLRLDQIVQNLGFSSMLYVILSDEHDLESFPPVDVQLASVCMQIALSKLWLSWNVAPYLVVGHSLGEYAALNVAGVLSDANTVYLVGKRAILLQEKCTRDAHAMLVVKGSVDEIASVLKDSTYEIACINSQIETVLAGTYEHINSHKQLLTNAGVKSTLLKVPYAFHSSQMDPVLADFENLASCVIYSKPKIPVLCPLDGTIVVDHGTFGPDYLVRHFRQPVNMLQAVRAAHNEQLITEKTVILEIGPHPAISGMISAIMGSQPKCLASLQRGRSVWQTLVASLSNLYIRGVDIRWLEYHRDFKVSQEVISLPAYSWDLKDYWMQYTNDWSLRKGDPPLTISNAPKLESTTIHRIVEEAGDSEEFYIVVEANIARKDLSPLVQGHEVDGIPLCTPSVYADIALSLGTYLLERFRPHKQERLVDVSDMTISRALILQDGATQQLIQAHTTVKWSSDAATIEFKSFDKQQKLQEHSRCVVRFRDRSLLQSLQEDVANVKQKLNGLRAGIASGATARFNRSMVYRAIRPLARFHNDYRAIDEIVLNSKTLEASSQLSFKDVKRGGNFHTHPAIIDSLTQSCGFTMNCNDTTDLDVEVFMNHGWESLQIYEPMDFEKSYSTYTRMTEGSDKLWHGDVTIFEDERVVAFFGKIAIQGVPRRVLKAVLSIETRGKPQTQQGVHMKQHALTSCPSSINVTQSAAPISGQSHTPKISQVLSVIAAESDLPISDLTDSTVFADIGVDSLLSLMISARLKEELDMDFDFDTLLFECPTVGDLKASLGEAGTSTIDMSTSGSSDATSSPKSTATGRTTPAADEDSLALKFDFRQVLQIISQESGVATEELTDDVNFADSGVDSLLSLIMISRLRDELDIDIHQESFFDCPTVAHLRQLLLGHTPAGSTSHNLEESSPVSLLASGTAGDTGVMNGVLSPTEADLASFVARRKAVDDYVQKYTTQFSLPFSAPLSTAVRDNSRVVLVTGASGGLGSHLVEHIAQMPEVTRVICLNRKNNAEPYTRQYKAMREKGIRFPEALKPKLLVLQTDTSRPMFGLQAAQYEELVGSVTYLIHNAWPMSAKRPLAGFEPQFQVMRNLIDFACDVVSRRPKEFKFSFQMVSSIGVVGHYQLGNSEKKIIVPEQSVDVDSVLPNGYSDAKWGCEKMLDETLHKHPNRFRAMIARLGQVAGSKTSGYWNPMEHFGFLVKSSQTLKALPNTRGNAYWTPVNDVARSLADLLLSDRTPYPIYHIENPVGQPWSELNAILADALKIPDLVPFEEWVERVRAAPPRNNPASNLVDFLDSNYLRMSCGGLVLDVKNTLEHSKTLYSVGPVSEEVVRKYIHIWREIGFLE